MRVLLAKMAKKIAKFMKMIGQGLFGGQGGVNMAQPEPDEAEEPEALDPENTVADLALERKRRGLEPQDVKAFAEAESLEDKWNIADRLTPKTRQWCLSLKKDQQDAIAKANVGEVFDHLTGRKMISGVPGMTFGIKFDPMPNPYRADLAKSIIAEQKEYAKLDQSRSTRRECDIDVSLIVPEEEPLSRREAHRAKMESRRTGAEASMSSRMLPRLPARMFG